MTTQQELTISAKDLGSLALPGFCACDFWIRKHAPRGLPYQIFPGIFSSIDAYSKRVVEAWFEEQAQAPPWLSPLGEIVGYKKSPHWSKFTYTFPDHQVQLRGSPDSILERADGSHVIVDLKTSKYTKTQDQLHPMYAIQLNAYALLGEHNGFSPISGLALAYTEPQTNSPDASQLERFSSAGFFMSFEAHILEVPLDLAQIEPLVARAREIYDRPSPPPPAEGCKDCERLHGLLDLFR